VFWSKKSTILTGIFLKVQNFTANSDLTSIFSHPPLNAPLNACPSGVDDIFSLCWGSWWKKWSHYGLCRGRMTKNYFSFRNYRKISTVEKMRLEVKHE
jgi:hypothetical protein